MMVKQLDWHLMIYFFDDLDSRSNRKSTPPKFISQNLLDLQTSYLVLRYNPIRRIQWSKCRWPWPKTEKICSNLYNYWISHILNAFSQNSYLIPKWQPNKVHFMDHKSGNNYVNQRSKVFKGSWMKFENSDNKLMNFTPATRKCES